jgi:hypothetical protein
MYLMAYSSKLYFLAMIWVERVFIEVIELPDSPSDTFKHRWEERDIPYTEGRSEEICSICGFPEYAECKSFCNNFGTRINKPDRY